MISLEAKLDQSVSQLQTITALPGKGLLLPYEDWITRNRNTNNL